jgi:hypothetical protein
MWTSSFPHTTFPPTHAFVEHQLPVAMWFLSSLFYCTVYMPVPWCFGCYCFVVLWVLFLWKRVSRCSPSRPHTGDPPASASPALSAAPHPTCGTFWSQCLMPLALYFFRRFRSNTEPRAKWNNFLRASFIKEKKNKRVACLGFHVGPEPTADWATWLLFTERSLRSRPAPCLDDSSDHTGMPHWLACCSESCPLSTSRVLHQDVFLCPGLLHSWHSFVTEN